MTAAKTDEARIVALMELIAAVRDGHTVLDSSSRYGKLGWLPFSASWYADGIFFRRLPKPRAEALGGQILSVDGVPIELVLERLRHVVPRATTARFRRWAPSSLHLPGLLYGLGLTDSPDVAKFEVALRDGKVTTLEFKRTPEEVEDEIEFVSLDSQLADELLRYREPDRLYRFEGLHEHRALYVGYRRIGVDEQENPWLFASRLVDYINTHDDVDRMIVDLQVVSAHPDHPPLSDGELVSEAIHLVFRVRPEIGEEASRNVGAELLRMCIRLLPEGAPDCEFSLRFYE